MWQESAIWVILFGLLLGGFLGVLAGSIGGLTLRLMRGLPVGLAAPAAGLAVVLTVPLSFFLLGWASSATRPRVPLESGIIPGVIAAVATPWIRRWP